MHLFQLILVDLNGFKWIFMVLNGFSCILVDFPSRIVDFEQVLDGLSTFFFSLKIT